MAYENASNKISEMLDVLGQQEGSILVRRADKWEALPPGPQGYVLAINDQGQPEWMHPDDTALST